MRATCPHCANENEYADERHGVLCKSCNRPFAPTTYVTTVPTSAAPPTAPMYTRHSATQIEEARARMYQYVDTYRDYVDRDRDIMMLAIYDLLKKRI